VPENVEVLKLYATILVAMDKLARLACADFSTSVQLKSKQCQQRFAAAQFATNCLGELPSVSMSKVDEVLATAHPDIPWRLALISLRAMTKANRVFENAMRSRPKQFAHFARWQLVLPTLRSKRDNGESFRQLAQSVELGEDYGLKQNGAADLSKDANAFVARMLLILRQMLDFEADATPEMREWAEAQMKEGCVKSATLKGLAPCLKELARKKFPPLTREKSSQDFWWQHAIHPILKTGVIELPKKYRRLADDSLKQKWWKAKPDLRAKNLFETACRKALKNLAPPITNKTNNRS
jgi:hypothetical protein